MKNKILLSILFIFCFVIFIPTVEADNICDFKLDGINVSSWTLNSGFGEVKHRKYSGEGEDNKDMYYCIEPGARYKEKGEYAGADLYSLSKKYDVRDCENGNENLECGVVAVIQEVQNNYGGDYFTTLIALRLWGIKSGIYTKAAVEGELTDAFNAYKATVNYLESNESYRGQSKPSGSKALYATNDSNRKALANAIQVYLDVKNGKVEIIKPEYKVEKEYSVDLEGKSPGDTIILKDVTIETSIDWSSVSDESGDGTSSLDNSEVIGENVSLISGTSRKRKVDNSYGSGKTNILFNVEITVPEDISDFPKSFKYKVQYRQEGMFISSVGVYLPCEHEDFDWVTWQDMIGLSANGDDEPLDIEVDVILGEVCDPNDPNSPNFEPDWEELGWINGCTPCDESHPNWDPETGKCEIKEDKPDKCPLNIDYSKMTNTCDENTEGEIEDPEMCSILNTADTLKQKSYDFTNKVKMNSKYCTIFCREELKFTFMDKTEVLAGRQFKYDVNSKIVTTQKLSTVIYATRQCTVPEINYELWEDDYIRKNDEVLSYWNTWKMWEARLINQTENEGYDEDGPCESDTCPPCLPDGCEGDECDCEYGSASFDSVTWDWYEWEGADYIETSVSRKDKDGFPVAASYNEENADGISGTEDSDSKQADVCVCDACAGKTTCNPVKGESASIKASEYQRKYNTAVEERKKLIEDIENCNLFADSSAYNTLVNGYIIDAEIEINYDSSYASDIKIESDTKPDKTTVGYYKVDDPKDLINQYCPSCGTNPKNTINSGTSLKEITKWECTGQETAARCTIEKINVPDNNAVNLETSKEQHFWQSQKFYTQVYTGNVSTSPSGIGYWIALDDYIYPIELYKANGSYFITVDYSKLGDATRPNNIKFKDEEDYTCAFNVRNEMIGYECDPLYDGYCEIECDPLTENCENGDYNDYFKNLGFVVRSVDLTNLFPNNRAIGMNWQNAESVIKQIQSLGNNVWASSTPQYVIELDPSDIREIRNYNKENQSYSDYSLECIGYKCTSEFLKDGASYFSGFEYINGRNAKNLYRYGG